MLRNDEVDSFSPPVVPDLGGLFGKDAQTLLAEGLVKASVSLNADALQAALFLPLYMGAEGSALVERALLLKAHQTPGVVKSLREALAALALKDFMSKININLGGAK